jgi:regulator of cell morphogenesis and NO signaling
MTTLETPVGELAVRIPAASRVFYRHHIDYCCGGKRSLAEACAKVGAAPEAVLGEIEAARRAAIQAEPDWSTRPLAELIDHILERYHQPLKPEMARLRAMGRRVAAVHGGHAPRMVELAKVIAAFVDETDCHLEKEERVLFPWIRSGQGASAAMPIQQLHREHDSHGVHLAEMRRLCDDYVPPAEACATWRALYLGLAELERELMEHIHLENNILFPRALAG